jgi:3-dehydroquinate synthase
MTLHSTVSVHLTHTPYDIKIGHNIISCIGEELKKLCPKQKIVPIITDHNIEHYGHLKILCHYLADYGFTPISLTLPFGEKTKSFSYLEQVLSFLLDHRIERNHAIIALGGGVIGDLTGFAASILRRGTKFIQIPTTLLSQVDSSVGGKTAINVPQGKNLVGSFYQPSLVLADINILKTLPKREFLAGYAEVIKYALLGNVSFFNWLDTHIEKIIAGDKILIAEMVQICCQMKADIVKNDEKEQGDRALLNLGHTFGHALEAETGYSDKLLHGEAVAIGMIMAFEFSKQLNLCSQNDVNKVKQHFAKSGLLTHYQHIQPMPIEQLIHHMKQDKKVQDGQMVFILNHAIGKSFIKKDVQETDLIEFLKDF